MLEVGNYVQIVGKTIDGVDLNASGIINFEDAYEIIKIDDSNLARIYQICVCGVCYSFRVMSLLRYTKPKGSITPLAVDDLVRVIGPTDVGDDLLASGSVFKDEILKIQGIVTVGDVSSYLVTPHNGASVRVPRDSLEHVIAIGHIGVGDRVELIGMGIDGEDIFERICDGDTYEVVNYNRRSRVYDVLIDGVRIRFSRGDLMKASKPKDPKKPITEQPPKKSVSDVIVTEETPKKSAEVIELEELLAWQIRFDELKSNVDKAKAEFEDFIFDKNDDIIDI